MENQPKQSNIENSPMREAYVLLEAKTPLELSQNYTKAEQPIFISRKWDYENPDQIQNKVKNILESVDPDSLPEEEQFWRQEILWFWYHHAISCAIWKKDKEKAAEYSNKALELQDENHPNKITKILSLLVNDKIKEAEEFVKTVEIDKEEAEGLIEDYKEGKFF